MTILITGGLGFIGAHLVNELNANNSDYKLIIVDIEEKEVSSADLYYQVDITKEDEIEELFSQENIDLVIHAASIVSPSISMDNPLLAYNVNFIGTFNLLKVMDKYNVNNFIYFSSSAVYGNIKTTEPIEENTILNPTTVYGRTKVSSEQLIQDYANKNEKFRFVILRPFSVVCTLIDKFYTKVINPFTIAIDTINGNRDKMTIFGNKYHTRDGTCIRDYIHIKDMINIIVKSMDYMNDNQESLIVNCGTGIGYTLQEVINSIENISAKKVNLEIGNNRQNEMISQIASSNILEKILKYKCQYSSIENIAQSVYKINR